MLRTSLTGLDRKRLRLWLSVFFLALAVPTGILVYQAYSQLKWEAFHQYRVLAEELAERIDTRIIQLINAEEARSFADYAFLNVAGDPAASFLQRSPLSTYPLESPIPGLVGYFQVDTHGEFTTPLVPPAGTVASSVGISAVELEQRLALQQRIEQILSRNRLVQDSATGKVTGRAAVADARHATAERRDQQAGPVAPSVSGDKDAPARLALDDSAVSAAAEIAEQQAPGQAAFDRLNTPAAPREQENKKQQAASTLGRVEDLKLDYRYQSETDATMQRQAAPGRAPVAAKRARKERSALPEPADESGAAFFEGAREADAPAPDPSRVQHELRIRTFESEIDPFEFSLLDSGHLVLFRKVWRDGQRYIQGAVIEQQPFVQGLIKTLFLETALSTMSDLLVAYRGDVFAAFSGRAARAYLSSAEELRGTLLYQTRLSAPLGELELILSITRLPAGAGGRLVTWLAAILLLVLCGGFYLMYRLGAGQIDLTRQQQDFVSAVSHELKTPLTSIRMYGEMLREGWASDEKKSIYYDYIFDESERLSRLIANVLQLARMTRNNLQVDSKPLAVAELLDGIRSRVSSQIERAGFELNVSCEPAAGQAIIEADPDGFTQIFINLVDNAIKFSASAEQRVIDIGCQLLRDGSVQFSVRDYGPGIPGDQMKKIFRLFYRSENELTRETVGTGIGLALVHQLARAMGGQVDVVNREPGAEFRVNIAARDS
ncbi:MAG: HAMP domain-containing histidine kinase [Gammaproteobacteria bacterium]|nr:HAMP domain-containing histidine kinase [Gammaproteobacteria bacterium]